MIEALRVGEPAIEVRLRRNARARRLILRAPRGGQQAVLTLPNGVSVAEARAFLCEKEAWLRARIDMAPPQAQVVAGAVFPFEGRLLEIRAAAAGRTRREGDALLVPGRPEVLPVRIGAWLREEARQRCVAGVARHAAALSRAPGRISLRDVRSRWGSCTHAGDLTFSWRLVLAPPEVLDYVVVHEVAHLAELNHSPRFWAHVRQLAPDYERPRAWLRAHGAALHAWDFRARVEGQR